MKPRYSGVEIEYGLSPATCGPEGTCTALVDLARRRLRHLPGLLGSSLFLENGAKLYQDGGQHPEWCTPEVDHPDDLVRYVRAGDRLLHDLLSELRGEPGRSDAALFRCNVDYLRPPTSWGLHESIAHQASPPRLHEDLLPFIASRVVYCGAGGLDPREAGIVFTLSPRSMVLCMDVSADSMYQRGLVHLRNEALAGAGFHRLHLICGEALCSDIATWLRSAATSLVVAMAEAGLLPGRDVRLADPLRALKMFATDPDLRCAAPLADGQRYLRALDIQWHYLGCAESYVDHDVMPPWAAQACRRWRHVLERLEDGPDAVSASLDWAMKRVLFDDHRARRGFSAEAIAQWNPVLAALRDGLRRGGEEPQLRAGAILGQDSPLRPEVVRWTPHLRARGLDWDQLESILELRGELCEIDVRFGQIVPEGFFAALECDLDHRVPGVERMEGARTDPPSHTRAARRGAWVRRLAGRRGCGADWDRVLKDGERVLVMSHPSGQGARWRKREADQFGPAASLGPGGARIARLIRLWELGALVRRTPPQRPV
jgi:hypothetical protein